MSGRTLQRRLEELGTSYQALLDEVRRRSARRLLVKTDLDTGEVAFLLGFEELNSFTCAFHAWEGTTPARWRESVLAYSSTSRPWSSNRKMLMRSNTTRFPFGSSGPAGDCEAVADGLGIA
jgi:AraC-like DNA-binding protein